MIRKIVVTFVGRIEELLKRTIKTLIIISMKSISYGIISTTSTASRPNTKLSTVDWSMKLRSV